MIIIDAKADREYDYVRDFIARIRQLDATKLNLIIEVTGERRPEKQAKVNSSLEFWLPAVNGTGKYGRWKFWKCWTSGGRLQRLQ